VGMDEVGGDRQQAFFGLWQRQKTCFTAHHARGVFWKGNSPVLRSGSRLPAAHCSLAGMTWEGSAKPTLVERSRTTPREGHCEPRKLESNQVMGESCRLWSSFGSSPRSINNFLLNSRLIFGYIFLFFIQLNRKNDQS
jgi:hypothetical protein